MSILLDLARTKSISKQVGIASRSSPLARTAFPSKSEEPPARARSREELFQANRRSLPLEPARTKSVSQRVGGASGSSPLARTALPSRSGEFASLARSLARTRACVGTLTSSSQHVVGSYER